MLFVDAERSVLQALERMLQPLRHEWRMAFAERADQALEALDRDRFDVLVTDLRMPGTNGVELMEQVLQRHPRVTRIVLAGHADRDVVVGAMRLAHQFLSKPCDAALLRDTLAQAIRLQGLMENPRLQAIASRVSALRTVPALYADIVAEMQSREPSVIRVAELVASDPAMTAKVLQVINSAFFGLQTRVSDPQRAVQLLGLDTIRTLVLSVQLYSKFPGHPGVRPAEIWQHGMRTARLARHIARDMGLGPAGSHDAFTAGLLHDVGKLVLAEAVPEYGALVAESTESLVTVERERLGATHAEVGAYLFGLWGLPYAIVEAIAWHHRPLASGIATPGPLAAVHCANAIDHELQATGRLAEPVDDDYVQTLDLREGWERWRQDAVSLLSAA